MPAEVLIELVDGFESVNADIALFPTNRMNGDKFRRDPFVVFHLDNVDPACTCLSWGSPLWISWIADPGVTVL